jgi:hypothetical protein
MSQQLILVDGTATYFDPTSRRLSSNLSNESGFPTGAIFGVLIQLNTCNENIPTIAYYDI